MTYPKGEVIVLVERLVERPPDVFTPLIPDVSPPVGVFGLGVVAKLPAEDDGVSVSFEVVRRNHSPVGAHAARLGKQVVESAEAPADQLELTR